jgi:uncharacterized protein
MNETRRIIPLMQRSPLDSRAGNCGKAEPAAEASWCASRYNVVRTNTDGTLFVWNTYSGSKNRFDARDRNDVLTLLRRKTVEAPLSDLAAYLFKRGYLIQTYVDEYQRLQLDFGQKHFRHDLLELILLASEDCNFRCRYCYEEFPRGTMEPWVRAAIKNMVRDRIGTIQTLGISWFGGEPLYGIEAIDELAPFFSEVAAAHGVKLTNHMTTNGYLLSPDVAHKLLMWDIRDFQITIDGPEEVHNMTRPGRDGSETWRTIMSNLQSLRSTSEAFSVRIRVNFDKETRGHVQSLIQKVATEFGNDPRFSMAFKPTGKWGGPNDTNLDICGVEDIKTDVRASAWIRPPG